MVFANKLTDGVKIKINTIILKSGIRKNDDHINPGMIKNNIEPKAKSN